MEKLTANAAIDLLSRHRLPGLDAAARFSHLLNWWGIDSDDLEFAALAPSLQQQILTQPEPPQEVQDPRYDALLLIALRAEYRGVTHLYLRRCLREAGLGDYTVSANIECLEACPCCGYRTLSARGEYQICDLCHWEDDGSQALDVLSGPNHQTLGQAREHFAQQQGRLPLDKWPHISKEPP
ncbi:CPCC family cysteine-rich protein [Pseudomonas protegens]|uniref:CPCC family cysteine-rich protein n=1 Tax=Pseudomonas protegens TaxID=380021 RepID=UPI0037F11424